MTPAELSPLQALRRSLLMVVEAAPKELRNLAVLNSITTAAPAHGPQQVILQDPTCAEYRQGKTGERWEGE